MSVMIEQDLKEILTKIDQRLERIENEVTDLKIGQVRLEGELRRFEGELKGEVKRVEGELKGEINRVEEKIDGLDKRLEFQEFINRGVLIGNFPPCKGG